MSHVHPTNQIIEPSLRVARVVYFTDLTRRNAPTIPLGAFAEIMLPEVHGLALKARANLSEDEQLLLGGLLRAPLAEPFKFLAKEFDIAWVQAEPGRALDFLAGRHTASLSVLAPHISRAANSPWWSRLLRGKEDVEAKLSHAVDAEFADLLKETTPDKPMAPVRIQVLPAAA